MDNLCKEWRRNGFCLYSLLPAIYLLFLIFLIKTSLPTRIDYEKISRLVTIQSLEIESEQRVHTNACEISSKPAGAEALPKGIVERTTDLEMKTLWGTPKNMEKAETPKSLLAIPVGIKQKKSVDKIVKKFISCNFTIMLFHYDGVVDEWKDLDWSSNVIHVSAIGQTKWWFAKRFLHPDIVSEYNYIFLWDEDLGVENFHPDRYLAIVQEEGLEISQPALDAYKSRVHYQITKRNKRLKVHRRISKLWGAQKCYSNSTSPQCTGWVEMMAPVFSTASWRCVWHLIQNDLIHAWGLDMRFGYCAQGDRTKNVGVVDAEYIVHNSIPSLGGFKLNQTTMEPNATSLQRKPLQKPTKETSSLSLRYLLRSRSAREHVIFARRWRSAAKEDKCWKDPYNETM